MLDTVHEVSTPELIELHLHCAGPVPRALAWSLDYVLRLGVLIGMSLLLTPLKNAGAGIWLLLWFVLEWIYPVLFEVLAQGATPGKRMMGLTVVNHDGSPVGWGASFTRNLMRTADFLPFAYGLGLLAMLNSAEFRRIGDVIAGTLVVYKRRDSALPPLMPAAHAVPWRPSLAVGREAQRAVLAFAERAPRLSKERAAELAECAPQLTDGAHGNEAVTRLYGLANSLTGRES